jgi:hypothetical protein
VKSGLSSRISIAYSVFIAGFSKLYNIAFAISTELYKKGEGRSNFD